MDRVSTMSNVCEGPLYTSVELLNAVLGKRMAIRLHSTGVRIVLIGTVPGAVAEGNSAVLNK